MISKQKELAIRDILESFKGAIIPGAADWEFPEYGLSLKFHEVNTAIKILKWVLSE